MKNIVILGAGFGGLKTALLLDKKISRLRLNEKYKVTLIDKNSYHTYTPTLYEIATTSKETADYLDLERIAAFSIGSILEKTKIEFISEEVLDISLAAVEINLSTNVVNFDYLVIALGSETNYFNIPGAKDYGLPLKTFRDAAIMRDKIVEKAYEKKHLNVVICGGGSSGVELAGELKKWLGGAEEPKCVADVTIVEGGPNILGGFNQEIVKMAAQRLELLGIKIAPGCVIYKVTAETVHLKNGQVLPYDIFVWTAGTKVPSVIEKLNLQKSAKGLVEVNGKMECLTENTDPQSGSRIYAIGDIVCFLSPKTGKPTPGVARAAIVEGAIVARNIIEAIKTEEGFEKKPIYKFFKPTQYSYIIPAGGKWAIACTNTFVFKGYWAWVFKGLVELGYLLSIMPALKALKIWLAGLKIFIKNDRLG